MVSQKDSEISECVRNIAVDTPYRYLSEWSLRLAATEKKFLPPEKLIALEKNEETPTVTLTGESAPVNKAAQKTYSPSSSGTTGTTSAKIILAETWETDFLDYESHVKYFQKMRAAQKSANESGKRVQICWRTYRSSVLPKKHGAGLEKVELVGRLVTALNNIKNVPSEEKEVKK